MSFGGFSAQHNRFVWRTHTPKSHSKHAPAMDLGGANLRSIQGRGAKPPIGVDPMNVVTVSPLRKTY